MNIITIKKNMKKKIMKKQIEQEKTLPTKIFWIKKDFFNDVEYDEEITEIESLDDVIFYGTFPRWERNIETYKWERIVKKCLFEKISSTQRNKTEIIFLKIHGEK